MSFLHSSVSERGKKKREKARDKIIKKRSLDLTL